MKQLKATFNDQIDAVYSLANGFVGCWGEWHGARLLPDVFGPARPSVQEFMRYPTPPQARASPLSLAGQPSPADIHPFARRRYELFEFLPPDRKVTVRVPAFKLDVALERADCPETAPAGLGCPGFGLDPLPSSEMAFGVASLANYKENTAVSRTALAGIWTACPSEFSDLLPSRSRGLALTTITCSGKSDTSHSSHFPSR